MTLDEYSKLKHAGIRVNNQISEWELPKFGKQLYKIAEKLGLYKEGKFDLEHDDELNYALDFYTAPDYIKNSPFDDFYEGDTELSSLEEEFLAAKINRFYSIFTLKETPDPISASFQLTDWMTKKTYFCIDEGLSKHSRKGHIIFTHLIPVRDTHVLGGPAINYHPSRQKFIKGKLSLLKMKKKQLSALDLCALGLKFRNETGPIS